MPVNSHDLQHAKWRYGLASRLHLKMDVLQFYPQVPLIVIELQ
ncbi:MAG: hypothetical protein AAGI66_01700 [Cyanobacteria bacterium P01_H01_bin.74]